MDRTSAELVAVAVWGRNDDQVRTEIRSALGEAFDRFEAAATTAYDDWLAFERAFAKDKDSATVVGFLFNVIARLTVSTKLLALGHLTLSGAAFRQAQEALAAAFVLAEFETPYRAKFWEGHFSVDKAVGILRKQVNRDPSLNREALDTLLRSRSFYSKFSHPTALAMADTITVGRRGHHLGASYDPEKRPIYERELESRTGFAATLPNAMDGVAQRLWKWPQFQQTG